MKFSKVVSVALLVIFYGCYSTDKTQPTTKTSDQLVEAIQIKDQARILELIEAGYPIEGKTDMINEPAYWAIVTDNLEVLKVLINNGLKLDTDWGMDRGNLLTNAVQFGHFAIVEALVEAGAPVIRDPSMGRSPLYSSIIYDHKEIEDYLRSKGAELNDWDKDVFERFGFEKNRPNQSINTMPSGVGSESSSELASASR